MSNNKGWVGVDLDGTLALYDHWRGIDHIGAPIPRMHLRVLWMIRDNIDVRIFTARVSPMSLELGKNTLEAVEAPIKTWCREYLGKELPITCVKDLAMTELWDDRCIQVIPNTGLRADGKGMEFNEPSTQD